MHITSFYDDSYSYSLNVIVCFGGKKILFEKKNSRFVNDQVDQLRKTIKLVTQIFLFFTIVFFNIPNLHVN